MANIKADFSKFIPAANQFVEQTQAAIRGASSKAINGAVKEARRLSVVELRKHYRLKVGEVKDGLSVDKRSRGSSLTSTFYVSGKPISLVRFLSSPKGYTSQALMRVQDRPRIKVRISPRSPVQVLKQAFLAYVGKGKLQIFRRTSASSRRKTPKGQWTALPIHKMDTLSLASTYDNKRILNYIKPDVDLELERVFFQSLDRATGKKL